MIIISLTISYATILLANLASCLFQQRLVFCCLLFTSVPLLLQSKIADILETRLIRPAVGGTHNDEEWVSNDTRRDEIDSCLTAVRLRRPPWRNSRNDRKTKFIILKLKILRLYRAICYKMKYIELPFE